MAWLMDVLRKDGVAMYRLREPRPKDMLDCLDKCSYAAHIKARRSDRSEVRQGMG